MTREEVQARVQQVLVDMFELTEDQVGPEANLYEDLDLDSLDAIDLAVKLKTETGIKLTEKEMKAIRRVDDITEVVFGNLSKARSLAGE